MPIRPFLSGQAFDPETIKMMSAVLEQIRAEIGVTLGNGKNPSGEIIAGKIIEYAQRGVRTQTALYLATMTDLKSDSRWTAIAAKESFTSSDF
jgi:hypothetical protein